MSADQKKRARELQREIGEVLLRSWDPISVRDEPDAPGEYDMYIGGVYRLLALGASEQDLATHLGRVEAEKMGYTHTEVSSLLPVARELRQVFARHSSPGAA